MPASSDIVQEVEADTENAWYLAQLEKQVRSSIGVIPFVGAGLSRPLGFPLWTEFLQQEALAAGIGPKIQQRIERGEYEEAAEALQAARGIRRFEDAVQRVFGRDESRQGRTRYAVDLLPQLTRGPVITTNFDRNLEHVFANAQSAFTSRACGGQVSTAVDALNAGTRLLLKLHGDYVEPQSRVLTLQQYAAAYGSANPADIDFERPLPRLLRLLIQSRPLLFLGCSLNSDRTIQVLGRVTREYPELAHYAVVERPAEDDEFQRRDRFLSDHCIRPIWYPTGRHDALPILLEKLVGHPQPSSVPTVTPRKVAAATHQTAREVAAKLQAAHYPDAGAVSDARLIGRSKHSEIYHATINNQSLVVKETRDGACNLSALRKLQGHFICVPHRKVSTEIGVPEWVGSAHDTVLEIQRFYTGIPLNEMIERGPFRVKEPLWSDVYESLITAVHHLNELGVVHRDISPSNILVSGDDNGIRLTVIDCSFAWDLDELDQVAVRNDNFTAPEQIAGSARPVSDWYSVAGTCFFLANGVAPNSKHKSAFEDGLARLGSSFNANIVESLLQQDPAARPHNFWQLIPRPVSQRVHESSRILTGALDLAVAGAIFLYDDDYEFVAREELPNAVKRAARKRRLAPEIQRYLDALVARK
jgi:hypothetical protein